MNRKEHIDKAALEYAQTRSENRGIAYLTFKDVAEWADRTMIAKACEILDSMLYMRDCGDYDCVACAYDTVEEFIDQFRKYMEE
jgi:hypothetical protein